MTNEELEDVFLLHFRKNIIGGTTEVAHSAALQAVAESAVKEGRGGMTSMEHEAIDRISCLLHNMEVLYTGGRFQSKKDFHKGLTKEARKLVKQAFENLAEAYQKQGEHT